MPKYDYELKSFSCNNKKENYFEGSSNKLYNENVSNVICEK